VAGSLIARGGTQSGNGGFVETSGYRLDVSGIIVATNAPKGRIGLWLLDPANIVINDAGPTGVLGTDGCNKSAAGLTSCSTIKVSDLVGRLNGGDETAASDIALVATTGITVNGAITWTSAKKLTLTATTVTVASSIRNTGDEGGTLEINATTINLNAALSMASGNVTLNATNVSITKSVTAEFGTVSINGASNVTIAGPITANTISVTSTTGDGTIAIQANLSQGGGGIALSAKEVTFSGGPLTTDGLLTVEATTAITLNTVLNVDQVTLTSPRINVNATPTTGSFTFAASTVNWADGIGFLGGDASSFTVSAPAEGGPTTFALASEVSIRAYQISINNTLNWSTQRLTLNSDRAGEGGGQGVYIAGGVTLTGTGGARLSIPVDASFFPTTPTTITLSGTEAIPASFTLGTGVGATTQTAGTVTYKAAAASVTVTNTASGGGGGSSSGETTAVVTPVVTSISVITATASAEATAKTAADAAAAKAIADAAAAKAIADAAAAKAIADAAAAKAIADAAAAKAIAIDTAMKAVVEQAITQAVATVVASTSAAVFVAPAPPPPATSTTSSAVTTTPSGTTTVSTSASTTSTATTATTTTTTTTTTTLSTANAGAPSTGQSTTVTQEFVEPLSVATLSSTASTVSDPGDASAATTSANSGPASQTATPASTATAAPAAPALTPVAINKDGADAGDFTLQTVKPPAPITTAKQEARPTERTTTTPVSPGIALQATQKVPAPSSSVLGREISGSGNSSNW
jgi:hypothetical protein